MITVGICESCGKEGMIYTHATQGGSRYAILSVEVSHDKGKPCRYIWQSETAYEEYGFPSAFNKRYLRYIKGRIKSTEDGTFYLG